MFKKPIKVKSNTQLKGSERKVFKDMLLKTFPNLTENEVNEFLPKKETLNYLKIAIYDDTVIHVYTVQKTPMVFDARGQIFPTVFLLWKFPNLAYAFTTHENVMSFISSGADLMLPGVVTPPTHTELPKYGGVSENDTVYVNLSNNKAAVAVGVAAQSSASMALSNSKGKCVIIHHFYGDNLCTLEGNIPIPNMGPPEWLRLRSYEEDFPELGSVQKLPTNNDLQEKRELSEAVNNTNLEEAKGAVYEEEFADTVENMDNLLHYCFLGAIKYSKQISLPILTSNFFKLHMIPLYPSGKTLDLKKTSYKKLKPFLEKMSKEGLISVNEIKKGVEAITSINRDHSKYREFYISPENRLRMESSEFENVSTSVIESYVITQNTLPLFRCQGYQKGDTLQETDVRKCVTKYIKENNLQDKDNERLVKPKDVLATVCKTENLITWEEIMERVCDAMQNCYKVKSGSEVTVNKGKITPIVITVAVRSGNKKVTLVDNLETFGIRVADFAKECQHGVAASTSIGKPPGHKYDQLLIQGNQVLFVYNLLIEKYKVPKRYVKGLENAPKQKS